MCAKDVIPTRTEGEPAADSDPGTPTAPAPTGPPAAEEPSTQAAQPTVHLVGDTDPEVANSGFLAPPQQPGELGRLGNYRVLKQFGEGGMGLVFQAEDLLLDRVVALKVMRPEQGATELLRRRFWQEAKAAASLQHDHIVTVYQIGEDRGVLFMAMQFLAGEPLNRCLKREGKLPLADVLRFGRQIAEGLAAAHHRGLVHRDIKPANIWLEQSNAAESPRVKILDFGLAQITGAANLNLTESGAVLGTPGYMSPEQAKGLRADFRSDLFSLGCVLYHMCTGREAFREDTIMATMMALAMESPKPIKGLNPEVPTDLVNLIMKLLAKEPEARPQPTRVIADALGKMETVLAGKTSGSLIPQRPVASPPVPLRGPGGTPGAGGGRPRGSSGTPLPDALRSLTSNEARQALSANAEGGPGSNSWPSLAPAESKHDTRSGPTPVPKGASDSPPVGPKVGDEELLCPRCRSSRSKSLFKDWCTACGFHYEPTKTKTEIHLQVGSPKDHAHFWTIVGGCGLALAAGLAWIGYLFLTGGIKVPGRYEGEAALRVEEAADGFAALLQLPDQGPDLVGEDMNRDFDDDGEGPFTSRFAVVGYVPNEAGGISGLVLAQEDEGKPQYAGVVAAGLSRADQEKIKSLKTRRKAPVDSPLPEVVWLDANLACTVEYARIDKQGAVRDSFFKGWQ